MNVISYLSINRLFIIPLNNNKTEENSEKNADTIPILCFLCCLNNPLLVSVK